MKQLVKRRTVGGSVLLTVVMVMFIMVMFLLSTLVLTKSANLRSYYTYFETQAQFAAQAALDSITNYAYGDEDFYNYVEGLGTEQGTFKVYFNDSKMPLKGDESGNKYVECTVVKTDEPKYVWDSKTSRLYEQDGWKIMATAEVGSGKNTARKTVVNYIYANQRDPAALEKPKNTWSYEYMTGLDKESGSGSKSSGTSGKTMAGADQAVVIMNEAEGGAANDNMNSAGNQVLGGTMFPDGRTKYKTADADMRMIKNDAAQFADYVAINSTYFQDMTVFFIPRGTGITFLGNARANQKEFNAHSTASAPGGTETYNYKDLPYFYVDGTLSGNEIHLGDGQILFESTSGQKPKAGMSSSGDDATMLVVHAGAINNERNNGGAEFGLYGDMYLHDPALDSNLRFQSNSYFFNFIANNIKKTNHGTTGTVGGMMVSNNNNLTIEWGSKAPDIYGDLIFTNPKGTLTLKGNGSIHIHGALVMCGTLVVENATITADGGVYLMKDSSVSGTVTINGAGVSGYSSAEAANAAAANYSAAKTVIDSIGVEFSNAGKTYSDIIDTIRATRDGYDSGYATWASSNKDYDYSLFPYYARLDEIWEEYVRWDLWEDGTNHGFAADKDGQAATEASVKPGEDNISKMLLAESIAAGHTYSFKKMWGSWLTKYSGNQWDNDRGVVLTDPGYRSFIVTHPTNSANAFIDAYTPVNSDPTIKGNVGNADTVIVDSYDKFKSAFADVLSVDGLAVADHTLGAADRKAVVSYGHDTAGNEVSVNDITINNAYVINKSGTYDVSAADKGVIFIDPMNVRNATGKSMAVALYGNISDTTTIVVNNSAEYLENDYTKPFPFGGEFNPNGTTYKIDGAVCGDEKYDSTVCASRNDLYLYLMVGSDGGEGKKLNITKNIRVIPSGAYYQISKKNISYSTDIICPDGNGESAWNALPAKKKFKFEMIPNVIINMPNNSYLGNLPSGEKGYSFQADGENSVTLWAAIIAPTTTIGYNGSGKFQPKFAYTKSLDADPVVMNGDVKTNSDQMQISLVGSICCNSFIGANWVQVIFGGEVPQTAIGTPPEEKKGSGASSSSTKSSGGENRGNNLGGNFFDNHHMADG